MKSVGDALVAALVGQGIKHNVSHFAENHHMYRVVEFVAPEDTVSSS